MRRPGRRGNARKAGWWPAVLYALALHAVLIALLVIGFRVAHRDDAASVMQAVVVRDPAPEQEKAEEKARRQEQEKLQEQQRKEEQRQQEERRQQEAEQQRVAEEQRRREAERERVEVERKKQEEEKKRLAEETKKEERRKQETEKKKRDEERKKVEKQHQQQAEQALREQLADEEKARAAARARTLAPQMDKYKAAIRQKVERNWVRPPTSRKGQQCTVRVRQAVGGDVLEAKAVCPSGDAAFIRSVEAAVEKSSPLPTPENPDLFDRDIEFLFRPEG